MSRRATLYHQVHDVADWLARSAANLRTEMGEGAMFCYLCEHTDMLTSSYVPIERCHQSLQIVIENNCDPCNEFVLIMNPGHNEEAREVCVVPLQNPAATVFQVFMEGAA